MKVINLFGSSGSGKTTTALGLTYELKKRGVSCEYISEYAKDLVFSKCTHLLEENQIFVFAEQHRRMSVLKNTEVEFLITDSPIILARYYGEKYKTTTPILNALILQEANSYDNINIFLTRVAPFQQFGRVQSEADSDQDSVELKKLLLTLNVPFEEYESNDSLAGYLSYKILTKR